MLWWILAFLLIGKVESIDMNFVSIVIKGLEMKPPLKIDNGYRKEKLIYIAKDIYKNQELVKFTKLDSICNVELDARFEMVIKDQKSLILLIVQTDEFSQIKLELKCKINEEVYLLDKDANKIFETYVINNNRVFREIGEVNENQEFKWTESQNILQRRDDFHGAHLRAMVEQDGIWTRINDRIYSEATYFTNNQTYDASEFVSGTVIDILDIMKFQLNFTSSYYLRKDRKWGTVRKYSNGTIEGFGAFGDLYYGRADLLAATPAMTVERIEFIDYLTPITSLGNFDFLSEIFYTFLEYRWFGNPSSKKNQIF